MKKHFRSLLAAAMVLALSAQATQAADRFINFNVGQNISVQAGLRIGLDAAVFNSEYEDLESGFGLSDFLVEGEIKYRENFTFKFDIDFNGDQGRDLYIDYTKDEHTIKGGFFRDPSSMSMNTYRVDYRFITRPSTINALTNEARVFGLSYKFTNENIFAEQAFYVSEGPSDLSLSTNFENMGGAGRWLYKQTLANGGKFHVGINGRLLNYDTPTSVYLGSTLESNIGDTEFLMAAVPNVKMDYSFGAEALFMANKFFARGEFTQRNLTKERDDESLFAAQSTYTTLEAWQTANPIRSNSFAGAYVEGGYLILGDKYTYNERAGYISGDDMKGALEVVARYSYTQMNDITEGDIFSIDRFHQNGNPYDFASQSSSVGGGLMQSATIGANYYISNSISLMANYTYSMLDNPYYAGIEDFSIIQLRLSIRF